MANLITESLVLPSAASHIYGDSFDGNITLRASYVQAISEEASNSKQGKIQETPVIIAQEDVVRGQTQAVIVKMDGMELT